MNDILVLGIDFGTTNTVISYYDKGTKILKDGVNSLIPSKIYKDKETNKYFFGNYIPLRLGDMVSDVITSFKINTMTSSQNKEDLISTEAFSSDSSIGNLSHIELFFRYIYSLVAKKLNHLCSIELNETILSVPSNFNDSDRKMLLEVAKKVGFNVNRLINEPTAAAFAYGINNTEEKNILVFDIGGGTLDVTLLEMDDNYYEVIDSVGINNLGGNNFTDLIYQYLEPDKNCKAIDSGLWNKCNYAKEKLSLVEKVKIKNNDIELILTNDKLKDICKILFQKINELIEPIASKIRTKEIILSDLIMVGGSSKIKILQEYVEDVFDFKPLVHDQPQHVVALGTCYYSALIKDKLTDFSDIILVDTLPLSLGIETADGNFSIIIPKNTPLPASRTNKYTIDTIGEDSVNIKVYQGEKNVAKKNYLIEEIIFDKISKTTNPIILITFKIDVNGLIFINIEDKNNGAIINHKCESNKTRLDKLNPTDSIDNIEVNVDYFDEEESKYLSESYKVKTKIENLIDNCESFGIDSDDKLYFAEILDRIFQSENSDTSNKVNKVNSSITISELISINKKLDEEYFYLQNGVIQSSSDIGGLDKNDDNDVKQFEENRNNFLVDDKTEALASKLNYYLMKDIPDFKRKTLEEIKNNIEYTVNNDIESIQNRIDYLDNSLETIKNLFSENLIEELKDLCLFVKLEIENSSESINFESPYFNELNELINSSLEYIDCEVIDSNPTDSIEDMINKINSISEKCVINI